MNTIKHHKRFTVKFIKKWQTTIAAILAIAMLITNFGSVGSMVYAQDSENDVTVQTEEEVDTIIRVDGEDTSTTSDETLTLTIHYNRTEGDYDGWQVHTWDTGVTNGDHQFTHKDDYGYLVDIEVVKGSKVGYIIRDNDWNKNFTSESNPDGNQFVIVNSDIEIWIGQGQDGYHTEAPNGLTGDRVELPKPEVPEPSETANLTIHYNRLKADYEGWNLYSWFAGNSAVDFVEDNDFGATVTIQVPVDKEIEYIIRKSLPDKEWDDKNHNDNQKIKISKDTEVWVTQGQNGYHETKPDLEMPDETPIDLIVHYERPENDFDGFKLHTWGSLNPEKEVFSYTDSFGRVVEFKFNSLQDVKNFGFIIYKEIEGQEWWANKDGGDKKNFDLDKLEIIKNVDRYSAHIYVKQNSDEIFYNNPNKAIEDYSTVTLHFGRPDKDYSGWNLWVWGTGSAATDQVDFEWSDDYGLVAKFPVKTGNNFGYIIRKGDWEEKNHDADQALLVLGDTEVWVDPGQNGFHSLAPKGLTGDLVELPETGYEDEVTDEEADMQVFVHYYRYQDDYRSWNMWAWPKGAEGHAYSFINTDDYGRNAKINLKAVEGIDSLGFIVRKGEWAEKDIDKDRFIDLTNAKLNPETGKLELHAYLVQDDQNIYYNEADVDKTPPLKTATFISSKEIQAKASVSFEDAKGVLVTDKDGNAVSVKEVILSKDKKSFTVTLENEVEIGETYYISKEGYKGKLYVEYYGIFGTKEFEDKFTYTGNDLGATYSKNATTFKVWAPTASEVNLKLYKDGHADSLKDTVKMTKGEKGVWEVSVKGDLHKTYYTYEVTVGNNTEEAVDPYAKTTGVNGNRAMVVDLSTTNPKDWVSTKVPEFSGNITDAILYELHLRDLSTHFTSGIENVGKFLQLTEAGTVSDKGLATGLDHLVEMGITHLHLLPSFDHRSVDETKLDTPQFNWGYDPQHYNVPEGSYSTDPYNGEVRINEFKQMVQSLHNNDIRVVMDVVYNHTGATGDSDFNKIVPGYYYRQDVNGSFANGSGCGNETASERSMMRKFMIDSVVYWAKEYNIKGFRFDLMALHDVETMNEIEKALHEIDPTIIIYGEGWTGGGTPLPDSEAAYKGNAQQTPGIAYFNDDMRDAVKGNVGNDWEPGFINGDTSNRFYERLQFGIVGSSKHDQVSGWDFWAANPSQSISYVSAHDNNTLYDKLLGVEKAKDENGNTSMEYLKQLQKQANAIVMMGQGVPFLHAGVEMMRTKGGNHNSYNSPDEVNQINWEWKYENYDIVNYYKGLIELRKAHPAFRMMNASDVQENLRFDEATSKNVMSYTISNNANGDTVSDIAVLHNVSDKIETGYLPKEGTWSMVVNGELAGTEVIEVIKGNTFEMQPNSSYVLMLDYEAPASNKAELSDIVFKDNHGEIKLTPAFHPYAYKYSMTVKRNVNFIDFSTQTLQGDASVVVLEVTYDGKTTPTTYRPFEAKVPFPEDVEQMVITLGVLSESENTTKEYTFTITRESEEDEKDPVTPPTEEEGGDEKDPVTPPTTDTGDKDETTKPKPEQPETGYSQLGLFIGIGSVLVVAGAIYVWYDRKRKAK